MPTEEQNSWVARVLGVSVSAHSSSANPASLPDLLPLWRDAKDEVDSAIEQLRRVLIDQEDDDLKAIADLGLGGLTGGESVAMMVALREANGAKLRTASQDFRTFLGNDEAIELIDENPFDVKVEARAKLGQVLDQIDAALAA